MALQILCELVDNLDLINESPVFLVVFVDECDDAFDVEVDDGLTAGEGFKEAAVWAAVVGFFVNRCQQL